MRLCRWHTPPPPEWYLATDPVPSPTHIANVDDLGAVVGAQDAAIYPALQARATGGDAQCKKLLSQLNVLPSYTDGIDKRAVQTTLTAAQLGELLHPLLKRKQAYALHFFAAAAPPSRAAQLGPDVRGNPPEQWALAHAAVRGYFPSNVCDQTYTAATLDPRHWGLQPIYDDACQGPGVPRAKTLLERRWVCCGRPEDDLGCWTGHDPAAPVYDAYARQLNAIWEPMRAKMVAAERNGDVDFFKRHHFSVSRGLASAPGPSATVAPPTPRASEQEKPSDAAPESDQDDSLSVASKRDIFPIFPITESRMGAGYVYTVFDKWKKKTGRTISDELLARWRDALISLPYWEAIEYRKKLNSVYSSESVANIRQVSEFTESVLRGVEDVADMQNLYTPNDEFYFDYIRDTQKSADVANALRQFFEQIAKTGPIDGQAPTDELAEMYSTFIRAKTLTEKDNARDALIAMLLEPVSKNSNDNANDDQAARDIYAQNDIGYRMKAILKPILDNNAISSFDKRKYAYGLKLAALVRNDPNDAIKIVIERKIPGLESVKTMGDYIRVVGRDNDLATLVDANLDILAPLSSPDAPSWKFQAYFTAQDASAEILARLRLVVSIKETLKTRCSRLLVDKLENAKKTVAELTRPQKMMQNTLVEEVNDILRMIHTEVVFTDKNLPENPCYFASNSVRGILRDLAIKYDVLRPDADAPFVWVETGTPDNWKDMSFQAGIYDTGVIAIPSSTINSGATRTNVVNFELDRLDMFLEFAIAVVKRNAGTASDVADAWARADTRFRNQPALSI